MPADANLLRANQLRVVDLMPRALTAAERERHRLDRLRELRATIDALRHEQTSHDPLLAWVVDSERRDSHR
ncbi:MAG TPA: hypothetical protein VF033_16990 [Steroidobacteraceae bacterium]|jgi:hypothetical protein